MNNDSDGKNGFEQRVIAVLARAARVPEEMREQMSRGDEIKPIAFECPICRKEIVMTRFAISDCKPCGARLYLSKSRSDRTPSFGMLVDVDWQDRSEDGCDGDCYVEHYRISWDQESTEFFVHAYEIFQGQLFEHDDELAQVQRIMLPEEATAKLRELLGAREKPPA